GEVVPNPIRGRLADSNNLCQESPRIEHRSQPGPAPHLDRVIEGGCPPSTLAKPDAEGCSRWISSRGPMGPNRMSTRTEDGLLIMSVERAEHRRGRAFSACIGRGPAA